MRKHRIAKIQEISGASEKEITPEEDKQNREWIAEKLQEIVAKTPANPAPVSASFDELLAQLKAPKRAPVVVNHADGRQIKYNSDGTQEILNSEKPILAITGDDTGTDLSNDTYSPEQLLILEQFRK